MPSYYSIISYKFSLINTHNTMYQKLKRHYYPLLPTHELTDKPVGISLFNQPLVLVRLAGQVCCFDDVCPHRHVPLSLGKSDGQRLHCFYHGWQFDAQGNAHIPSCMGNSPKTCLTAHACLESDGWIWVGLTCTDNTPNFEPPLGFVCPDGFDCHDSTHALVGDFVHSIENFLDPTHTPYIHQGLLRNGGIQRMHISQTHDQQGFCTTYQLLDAQDGWITKLFGAGININKAYFQLPSIAHIDYLKDDKLVYRICLAFVPCQTGQLQLSVRVCIPKGIVPSVVKFAILRPFVKALLAQDQYALIHQLERHTHIKHTHGDYVICANDLVIDHLLHLLVGTPEGVDKAGIMVL